MIFPNYFADADSSLDNSDVIIFGIPYDKTSSFRSGAEKGPEEIRKASWNFETYNIQTGFDLKDIMIHDHGDLDVSDLSPDDMVKKVKTFSKKIVSKKKFPIAFGGEHSITPGIIKAFPKNISVVTLDAHLDFRNIYEKQKNNHACANRRIMDHIGINNLAIIGTRSAEKDEYYEAKSKGLFFRTASDIKKNGIKKTQEDVKKHLKTEKIYLSLDIDVIDPVYAPGTSTPEPFGLSPYDIIECIDFFSPYLIGFDIVEVCPTYDQGQTAILAAKIVRLLIEKIFS
jgi:agmatinase